jgi:diphthamide biosynthesis methyltransferase
MAELLVADFGGPLHSFIIPGEMHPMEEEMLAFYRPAAAPTVKPSDDADRI